LEKKEVEMQWISFEDRMPPPSTHVLATNGEFIIVAENVFVYVKWRLQSIICTCCDREYDEDLTHWMPLPNPPKD